MFEQLCVRFSVGILATIRNCQAFAFSSGAKTCAKGGVFSAEDYVYSSARDYAGEKGLLEIKLLE